MALATLLALCLAVHRQLATHSGKEACQVLSNSYHGPTRRLSLAEEALAAVMVEAAAEALAVEAVEDHLRHPGQAAAVEAHLRHQLGHSGKIQDCPFRANAGLLHQLGRHTQAPPSESSFGSCRGGTLSQECPCAREVSLSL